MSDLTLIAGVPGVKSAVLGDLAGAFFDAVEEQDGEGVAAVMGFLASIVSQVGTELGLGTLDRMSLAGEAVAHLVLVDGSSVLAARVEGASALGAVESAVDAAVQGGR
jgi:predicted regulator of Ras-like GTPase activity (Roadblock/LC7/MglB family)